MPRPSVRQFIDVMLNSKYNDAGSFDDICKATTNKTAEQLFSTSNGLSQLYSKFADMLENSDRLAKWTAHLVGVQGENDSELRRSVRLAFSVRDWPPPVTLLPPNQVVYLVCEPQYLEATRQLEAALTQAPGIHLKVKIIQVDPQQQDTPASTILPTLQVGTFIIECRGDAVDTLPVRQFAELMAAATIRDYYIAYLPGYFGSPLAGVPAIDLTQGFDNVAEAITNAFAHVHVTMPKNGGKRDPDQELGEDAALEPSRAFAALAKKIVTKGLVVCVGADLPERLSGKLPSQNELATQLLVEAGLIDAPTAAAVLRREPLVPNFWASFLNRLVITSRGEPDKVSPGEWKNGLAERIRNSVGLVPSLTGLAQMLLAIQKTPPEAGQRLVIVTTNVDLALEHAFIEAGLEFEAWVLAPMRSGNGAQFSYSATFEKRQVAGNVASISGIIEETVIAATEAMKRDYKRDVADGRMTLEEYSRLRQRNKAIAKIYERAAKPERDRLATKGASPASAPPSPGGAPLLIKLNGSCHDEGEFIASADEDRYEAATLPAPALTGITNAPMVMIGYGLADSSLLDFHTSILRSQFAINTEALRIALVDSESWPKDSIVASLLLPKAGQPKSFFGFEVVDTSLEPGLKAIADSYANAISTTV